MCKWLSEYRGLLSLACIVFRVADADNPSITNVCVLTRSMWYVWDVCPRPYFDQWGHEIVSVETNIIHGPALIE